MTSFVIGVFNSESDAEIALNNLAEADFPNHAVTVITKNLETDTTLQVRAKPHLTLQDIAKQLNTQTLAKKMINRYKKIQENSVIIAVKTDDLSEGDAAAEILADQNGQMISQFPID